MPQIEMNKAVWRTAIRDFSISYSRSEYRARALDNIAGNIITGMLMETVIRHIPLDPLETKRFAPQAPLAMRASDR